MFVVELFPKLLLFSVIETTVADFPPHMHPELTVPNLIHDIRLIQNTVVSHLSTIKL